MSQPTQTNIFESSRLAYRGVMDADLDELARWKSMPEQQVGAHAGGILPFSTAIIERTKARVKEHALSVLAVDKESGAVIGHVFLGAGEFPMEYDVGLNVKTECWGKGYATEIMEWVVNHAFNWMLGAHRISVGAFASNPAAVAVYKKVGFVQEGVKRKARFAAGKWEDLVELGILEEEWRDRVAKSSGTKEAAQA